VVGFGGRIIGPGEPKYLNSPDSPVFHKGTLLYHLHLAKGAIRKEESVIVVEGYFDVLRLALAGIVGALLARGNDPWTAATAAVYAHGLAGDQRVAEHGIEGMLAGELADSLPAAIQSVQQTSWEQP